MSYEHGELAPQMLTLVEVKADEATGLIYQDLIVNHRKITFQDSESSTWEEFVHEWRYSTALTFENHLKWLRAARNILQVLPIGDKSMKSPMYRAIEEQISEVELASRKHELTGITLDEDVFKGSRIAESIQNAVSANHLTSVFDLMSSVFLDMQAPLVNRTLDRRFESMASGAARHDGARSSMRRDMVAAYQVEGSATLEDDTMVWCPVSHAWFDEGDVKCAKIMPLTIGPEIAAFILGEKPEDGEDILYSAKNSIPLCNAIEALFDSHNAIIMPYAIENGITQFKFVLLNKAILKNSFRHPPSGGWIYFEDLHNRPLEFKNDYRPAKRSLFWHFAHTLERRRLSGVTNWHLDSEKLTVQTKDGDKVNINLMWTSPGGYVKRSVLVDLANWWGYGGAPDDFCKWITSHGLDASKDSAEEDELLAKAVAPVSELAAMEREAWHRSDFEEDD